MTLKPLDGVRIVGMGITETEGIVALLFSDYGAEVVRLEFLREEKEENSQDCRVCDRRKIRVRFRSDELNDRKWLEKLFARVDAVVTSVLDIQMLQWSLDVDTLRSRNPGVVYTLVTGYGQTGPYGNGRLCDEVITQAESSFMLTTGLEYRDPVRGGNDFAIFTMGASACIGTLMALIDAQHTGRGRRANVSMMDSVLYNPENQFSIYLKSEHIPERLGDHYAFSAPVGDFTCRDGEKIVIPIATGAQQESSANVMEHPEWLENPGYRNVEARLKNYHILEKEVSTAFVEYTSGGWMKRLQTQKCMYGRVNGFKEVARYEQVQARHTFIEIMAPDGTKMAVLSNPLVMDGKKNADTMVSDTMMCYDRTVDQLLLT